VTPQMVDGKTVAVVGPAATVGDQRAQVDAHDVVVRAGADHWPWHGYGDRMDVAVLDGHHSARWLAGDYLLPDAVVLLKAGHDMPDRNGFVCRPVPLRNPFQVTVALWHLAGLSPESVTVFGADFYTVPFRAYTDGDYQFTQTSTKATGTPWAEQILDRSGRPFDHQPKQDLALIRQIREDKGWPVGDERFLKVLAMSDDEYDAATAGWL